MRFPRSAGLLLHPTSLPGPHGIGDLGEPAHAFVDWLAAAGQRVWQVLPLGPTGYGDSPYQCVSAFAGNPFLLSPEWLAERGLLTADDLSRAPGLPEGRAEYGAVVPWKNAMIEHAAARLDAAPGVRDALEAFREAHAHWLDDYALFRALKRAERGAAWWAWPERVRRREPGALDDARRALAPSIRAEALSQWAFFEQWAAVREHCNARGIAILGDAPIFAALDSADVWARPGLFHLDGEGRPTAVAGVPPDYFSATGQLWGNPLYRWDALEADGFAWWIARLRGLFEQVDRVRLDHFIGFVRYWEVPATARDARAGRWRPGPGRALFDALERALGPLPIVAEDLGETGADVEALRDALELPGMRVLQFAFGAGAANAFLPHRHAANSVVYTGTHDNDTAIGWWATVSEAEREFARAYLGPTCGDPAWDLMRAGAASVADTFVAPAQDALSLPGEARLNFPGRDTGNWTWRLVPGQLDERLAARLRALAETYERATPAA